MCCQRWRYYQKSSDTVKIYTVDRLFLDRIKEKTEGFEEQDLFLISEINSCHGDLKKILRVADQIGLTKIPRSKLQLYAEDLEI